MKIRVNIKLLCVLYVITWLIAPPLAFDSIYRILAVACSLLWIVLNLTHLYMDVVSPKKCLVQKYLIYGIIFIFIRMICSIFFDNQGIMQAINTNIHYFVIIIVGYIGGVYFEYNDTKSLKTIYHYIIALMVIFSITSILRDPAYYSATRMLNITSPEAREYARNVAMKGIGTFAFFSFSSLLAPFVLSNVKNYSGWKKVLMVTATIILFVGIISSGYLLALIIAVIGVCFHLIYKSKSPKKKMLILFFCVIIILFMGIFTEELIKLIEPLFSGTMFENKIHDLQTSLATREFFGTFNDRWIRYEVSINGIFSNLFMGSYLITGSGICGGHSSILDVFSQYGIIGEFLWIFISVGYPYAQMKILGIKNRVIYLLPLVLTMMLNPYTIVLSATYFLYSQIKDN